MKNSVIHDKPKVTIITVTYNALAYIEKTIESIAAQTYENIEYIVVDGKSSDGTLHIINKYRDTVSQLIHESDNGIYDAMNKGIIAATGRWINFMNAGDTFAYPQSVEKFVQIVKDDTDIFGAGHNYIDPDTGTYSYNKPFGIKKIWEAMPSCHQSMFVKSKIMKKELFSTNYRLASDYDFVLKCYTKGYRFEFSDMAICNFLGGGAYQQQAIRTRIESMKILLDYIDDIDRIKESVFFQKLCEKQNTSNYQFSLDYNKFLKQLEVIKEQYENIGLYGFGKLGHTAYAIFKDKISVIFDQNEALHNNCHIPPVYHPKFIEWHKDFDIIVITVLGRETVIKKDLTDNYNVPHDKIITVEI